MLRANRDVHTDDSFLTCSKFTYSVEHGEGHFYQRTIKHVSSSSHQTNSSWRLKTLADGKFVISKQPTLVQFRPKPVQVEDNAATAAESSDTMPEEIDVAADIDTDAENLVAEMTAAAELGEQLNANAESSVVEIGSAELGESSSSNTDTISLSSSIAQLFDVKSHEVTDEGLANLYKFPS